jgi:Mannosyl-glycoprotein endo-beta-N-acetylglucosaminidase
MRIRRLVTSSLVLGVAVVGAACEPQPPPPPPSPLVCAVPDPGPLSAVAVMGPCSELTVDQIVGWWNAQSRPTYRATVPIDQLAAVYVEEGYAEGVRGDIAFAQAVIETGWFSFSGRVPPGANNFAGIGATDSTADYAVFADARIGVRAHIQHLRAYADATATSCAVPPLHNPCVDPRFHLVTPKGKAATWNQFGNGIWATDPAYASKVVGLYQKMLNYNGLYFS